MDANSKTKTLITRERQFSKTSHTSKDFLILIFIYLFIYLFTSGEKHIQEERNRNKTEKLIKVGFNDARKLVKITGKSRDEILNNNKGA